MRVYVASKFENKHNVRLAQMKLTKMGHTITHDWTSEHEALGANDPGYFHDCAMTDFIGAAEAEVLIVLTAPDMKGAWTEVGIALACGTRVIIVDPYCIAQNYIFQHCLGVHKVTTLAEAISLVNEIATQRGAN